MCALWSWSARRSAKWVSKARLYVPRTSTLAALSHGCEAIRESLTRIELLLGHEGLTVWYMRMASPLVTDVVLFISKRATV
mmetsp:Transcript_83957/g.147774  ORF Transcript_83957/g.147774 Transcript_83957/m.147774 type:complete len:81 (-) Transcript_83957:42-284(-)